MAAIKPIVSNLTNEELAGMFELRKLSEVDGKLVKGRIISQREVLRRLDAYDDKVKAAKQAKEADRILPSLNVGVPGSAERIEAMRAYAEKNNEETDWSFFTISDEEIADRVAGLMGLSETSSNRKIDMRD